MFIDFLDKIIDLLPELIQNNTLFTQIITSVKKEVKDDSNYMIMQLAVAPSLYKKIKDSIKINFTSTSKDENILYFTLLNSEGLIAFKLKEYYNTYRLELSFKPFKASKKVITLTIASINKLEKLIINEKESIISEYEYNLTYYDHEGNIIPMVDLEEQKDINFSNEFLVPLENAREYRLNFKKYASFLNKNRFQKLNQEYEKNNKDMFSHPALRIENLEVFLKAESKREIANILNEPFIPESYANTGALDSIVIAIKSVIGESEEVIISDNLFDSLNFYLNGLTSNMLYNKGILIKKLNGIYTLYYLHLENNQVLGINSELRKQDIEEILTKDTSPEIKDELNSFFGKGNILK